ncbi:ATP-binding protein [Embleya sp. NPDC001921]
MDVLRGIECRTTWLAREPASVAVARAHVTEACRAWGLYDIEPAAVVAVSELATNAVIHTESAQFGVVAWRDGRRLSVEVHDSDPTPPVLRCPTRADDHGRGLLLVVEMCDRWGVLPVDDGDGKAVWFCITGPAP